jgi:hypothetical protein
MLPSSSVRAPSFISVYKSRRIEQTGRHLALPAQFLKAGEQEVVVPTIRKRLWREPDRKTKLV